jgi:hypothetical protein
VECSILFLSIHLSKNFGWGINAERKKSQKSCFSGTEIFLFLLNGEPSQAQEKEREAEAGA